MKKKIIIALAFLMRLYAVLLNSYNKIATEKTLMPTHLHTAFFTRSSIQDYVNKNDNRS